MKKFQISNFFRRDRPIFSSGLVLVNVLIFATIAITITIGLVNWSSQIFRTVKNLQQREQALQVAEAGLEYYRWHLAHFPSDFSDGTSTPGPYVHTFADDMGNILGSYSLTITPPRLGSTLVTVKSVGTLASTSITRTLQTILAIPSFAKYAFVANDFMRFGSGTVVNGPIHSNQGIHFDGLANNIVQSALATTTDPDNSRACSPYPSCATEWGVYTLSGTDDPQPPTGLPNRPDVFVAGRQVAMPAVSFSGITANFNLLQTQAIASDPVGNKYNISGSGNGNYGYHIIFNYSSGTTTYDLYKVKSLRSAPSGCSNDLDQTNWGTWSIDTSGGSQSLVSSGNKLPSNGVIFISDNVWVEGTVGNNARITIAAAKLPQPATPPDIIVNTNLLYAVKDGSNVIGLISQGNVTIGLYSDDSFEIDGALVAQNGRVGRFYYASDCNSTYQRTTITIYGMIATFIRYGFAYTDNTGYTNRNITYDPNLLYGPPPSFPLSASSYVPLSWQELNM